MSEQRAKYLAAALGSEEYPGGGGQVMADMVWSYFMHLKSLYLQDARDAGLDDEQCVKFLTELGFIEEEYDEDPVTGGPPEDHVDLHELVERWCSDTLNDATEDGSDAQHVRLDHVATFKGAGTLRWPRPVPKEEAS